MNCLYGRGYQLPGAVTLALLLSVAITPCVLQAQSFEEQHEAIALSPATQREDAMLSMLKAGLDANKPSQAIALTQQWLRQNVAADPQLLYFAGKAAELSGNFNDAATLYRQYLTRADLDSPMAADAILGTYTILINQLDDSESAYQFGKTQGHALVRSAQARQFDRWFMGQAKQRDDQQAMASRLLALLEADLSEELLKALYQEDFRWLLNAVQQHRLDVPPYSRDFVQTVKAIADQLTFDDELKRLLDWEISIKAYNADMLAGNATEPPIAEAEALLERFPQYALNVQTDWAGGRRGRDYRGDHKKYWPVDLDTKMQPVRKAVSKLSPYEAARYYQSWSNNYYDAGPDILKRDDVAAAVSGNAEIFNQKFGPQPDLNAFSMSYETAAKLAPLLKNNPDPEASFVRALAAAGEEKNLDKAIEALLTTEAWRLDGRELNGSYADRLWHSTGRPDGSKKRDQVVAKSKQFWDKHSKLNLTAKDPAKKRLDTFNKLWKDYRSSQPQTPDLYNKLLQILVITPEAIPKLIQDQSIEAKQLVRTAFERGIMGTDEAWKVYEKSPGVSTQSYANTLYNAGRRHYGVETFESLRQRYPKLYKPHPLEPVVHQELVNQIRRNDINPELAFAWLNLQFPDNRSERVATAQKLMQSPAWNKMPFELRYGIRDWFAPDILSDPQQRLLAAADPQVISQPLLDLAKDADVQTVVDALDQTIQASEASPVRHEIRGLDRLAELDQNVFTDPKVIERIYDIVGPMRSFQPARNFGQRLLAEVQEQRDPAALHLTAPYLWRHTESYHRTLDDMIRLADELVETHPSAAQALSQVGLQTIARHKRGHTYYDRNVHVPQLKNARGKAMMAMGMIDIPVPASHPAYGIYRSQAQYVIGNPDSARELYRDNACQLLSVHRDLSIAYLLWVLQHHIDNRDEEQQEVLARALLSWMQESPETFSLQQRLALELAYGDIALQRGMLDEAHRIYGRIRNNPDYQSVFDKHQATLRQVLVERISGDYDGALQTLLEIEAEKIPRLTTAAQFARAEVFYAMEEYQDAADELAKVLERDPDHADATILLGRVQLKLQKLIEATEVELGSATDQASIVPGEMLKVTLSDPTLSVSSGATNIEVVVWTTSGDREHLLLRQFGDQKTKYRGEVRTALGKPSPDDRTLQLVGDDEIYYAYSERFREKMPDLKENRGGPIIVVSDASLTASARKLLSENEQRIADMQRATDILKSYALVDQHLSPERLAEIRARAEAIERRRMLEARVKPGNPIHVRVVDPDRGRTAEVDELVVSVRSSSGDGIARVVLEETDTHSGRFEGQIMTREAQAMAFGSSTQAGLNPNMVISPRSDYPAWRPVAGDQQVPWFMVDLNDNVALKQLQIDAAEPGFELKRFMVQTAMSPQTWTTVATYPDSKRKIEHPWQPSVTVVNEEGRRHHDGARSAYELADLRQYVEAGWLATPAMAIARNVAGPSEALPGWVTQDVAWKRSGRWDNPAVVVRFQAYFYEPVNITRRFELKLGSFEAKSKDKDRKKPTFLIAVDGRTITSPDSDRLTGEINLKAGVHKFEIWATGWIESIGFGRNVTLLANLDDPNQMVPVTHAFFDPKRFPAGLLEHRNAPATIQPLDDGRRFAVDFAPDSSARLIRILFVEQPSPVPSLEKLRLTDTSDRQRLPAPLDYAELRKNDQLEIITGDRVTIQYVDDRFITEGQQNHERFLNVSYSDGEVEFADIEPRYSSRHQREMPYHERLLRFVHDKPLSLVIRDADMDISTEPDTVTCMILNDLDERRTLTAVETGPSTGTFRAWITPVAEPTQAPDQIRVNDGGQLKLIYRDEQNLHPGVPYDRVTRIDHTELAAPRIEIAHATIQPIEANQQDRTNAPMQPLNIRIDETDYALKLLADKQSFNDQIPVRYHIDKTFLTEAQAPDQTLEVVHGRHALIDIIAPQLALGTASKLEVFLQSDTGRRAAGIADDETGFDPSVPGTVRAMAGLGKRTGVFSPQRGGYSTRFTQSLGNDYQQADRSYETGRFRLWVPLIAGTTPKVSFATTNDDVLDELDLDRPIGPMLRTGERIHIGVPYTDEQGQRKWATASARVVTRPMLDVMQEDYRTARTEAHVGERLYIRVVDLAADQTPERDQVRVYIATRSGEKHHMLLEETEPHSGVFKGSCQLVFADDQASQPQPDATDESDFHDVRMLGMPVIYGDTIGVRYTDASDRKTTPQFVAIAEGADGTIVPFSKQYTDSKIAMETQFAMAESYLEMARRRRKLGQDREAQLEFERARQLLAAAITQFRDPNTRAHAEYLLGNLTMEDAQVTDDPQLQQDRFHAALARYLKVTGSYPDTPFASKAQFKTALVYEQLGEPDIAAQEYVKLAYKHPESEHLATAMARLGTHFQRKAVGLEKEARPLLAQTDDADAVYEGEARWAMARQEYIKAAQIFERLQERFANHELAATAGLRAGQLYMRAEDFPDALRAFMALVNNTSYDGATLRSEAMYWAAQCQQQLRETMLAYALYKRITYDFPESKWAAYARAQLSSEQMLRLDQKLEIERLEAGR